MGSSPLARGAQGVEDVLALRGGIIPARAGSTCPCRPPRPACRDHPRSRGEHVDGGFMSVSYQGSSPLARGTLVGTPDVLGVLGIIPARAGSTKGKGPNGRIDGDHPRSRGEHRPCARVVVASSGSSPLARGARDRVGDRHHHVGIIPARAGSTRRRSRRGSRPRDHPRSRGEHGSRPFAVPPYPGSSPLARGARVRPASSVLGEGIIPARAGSTRRAAWSMLVEGDHPRSRGEHDEIRGRCTW